MKSRHTRAVHSGPLRPGSYPPLSPALYTSSVYRFADLGELEEYYAGGEGFLYARMGHPNAQALAEAVSDLEGAQAGVATNSGISALAAVLATIPTQAKIVASHDLYGGTQTLLNQRRVVKVDLDDTEEVAQALTDAALLVVETISNPYLRVAPIPQLAEMAHKAGARLLVDNTFATPILSQPLEWGADGVIHSATKYLGGHSDLLAGVFCADEDWVREASQWVTQVGPVAEAFSAWLALRGLRTLALRIDRQSQAAFRVAHGLKDQGVRVYYPGLEEPLPAYLSAGSGMVSFDLGTRQAAQAFFGAMDWIPIAPSLGDVSTTLSYPAGTSHRGVGGIPPGLIRISVGIEDIDEIWSEILRGLEAV